jgi:hypothetical protein
LQPGKLFEPTCKHALCRIMQGCAPRLCRACGAAAKAALKRSAGDGAPPSAAKGGKKPPCANGVHRASSGGGGGKGSKGGKASGGGSGAAKARVHLAQPAVRGVTAARAERSTHRHKKLFTDEPGALAVHSSTATLELFHHATEGPANCSEQLSSCCSGREHASSSRHGSCASILCCQGYAR